MTLVEPLGLYAPASRTTWPSARGQAAVSPLTSANVLSGSRWGSYLSANVLVRWLALVALTTSQTAELRPEGTENQMSWWVVSGVPPVPCGKLALGIVQVLPAVLSEQAPSTVPAESEITAPVRAEAPATSVATLMVTVSKALRAALASAAA